MDDFLKRKLIDIAVEKMKKNDPSHDINHVQRVTVLAERIASIEGGDLDVIISAAIFHDVVNYPKNHHKRLASSGESADFAKEVLEGIESFSAEKIMKVHQSINSCSFSKGLVPDFLEAKILQDADGLEATGAIAIMRTFSSAGSMNRSFYNNLDPFCKNRNPDDSKYALDLFFTRLLVIQDKLHTKTAKDIAKKRIDFLKLFLIELESELS